MLQDSRNECYKIRDIFPLSCFSFDRPRSGLSKLFSIMDALGTFSNILGSSTSVYATYHEFTRNDSWDCGQQGHTPIFIFLHYTYGSNNTDDHFIPMQPGQTVVVRAGSMINASMTISLDNSYKITVSSGGNANYPLYLLALSLG